MNDINVTVKYEDNSNKILRLFNGAVARGLDAIGATAERYAKKSCPVDTGRLRNSITYATKTYSGQGNYTDNKGNAFSDAYARGSPGGSTVYVGTNVEYGSYVELGTSRMAARPFLRPAASNHSNEYKQLMEDSLKNA